MTDDDVDPVAVERAVKGDRGVPLNRAEMRAAWQTLEQRGASSTDIANLLGVADRTVLRWRNGTYSPQPRADAIYNRPSDLPGKCDDCGKLLRRLRSMPRHMREQHGKAWRS